MAASGFAASGPAVPGAAAAPARPMSDAVAAVRLVTGFAGFGAGSVNLAIASSFFAAAAGPAQPLGLLGAAAALWGTALLAGAIVFLAKEPPAGGRRVRYALGGAAAVHVAAIAFAAPRTSGLNLTQLSALLLTLMIIASLGWLGRAEARREGGPRAGSGTAGSVRPGRLLAAAFAGAVLVAGIATPGLAASTAGQYAVPHGEHGNLAPAGHHQR
ncbi:hypothetical protein DFO47_110126 [Arthrobacter sp. AG258]|uniref:hypothetical protein n=1 Tax=Arthrobacter sp. AG258 TaxID=2183899 RepID=UPI00105C67CF|nr:hypothetical protein [Arthrobacter sp. AG258]TDT75953.1 hypothetical protein DFO47_110126 [Arthrobacter sp. AG258]